MNNATARTFDERIDRTTSPWSAIICMTLMTFTLVASEFLPVSVLTPIADELGITAGQAGQAISFSGFFAVITSLFSNAAFSRTDRRAVVLFYTFVMVASGVAIAFAPNYLVFMLGRALIGIAIGGFWSLATSIVARIAAERDVPKALAMLQGGSALAFVIAQPMGSFLGGLIGWRGAFFTIVPVGIIAFIWQVFALPRMPGNAKSTAAAALGLLRDRRFAVSMIAMSLFFMGQFALSTYLRPVLGDVTRLDVNGISLVLLGIGLAGLLGTFLIGFVVGKHLNAIMVGFPAALAAVAWLLVPAASHLMLAAALLCLFGFFVTPIPVAWNTWMTRAIPAQLEAGGGLQIALIQAAITAGAFTGGTLFDHTGWASPIVYSGALFLGAAAIPFFQFRR